MKEEVRQEIIKRMEILKIDKEVINDFRNNLYICNSNNKVKKISTEQKHLVEKAEKEKNIIVYYLIKNENSIYLLYLKNNKEEWKREKQDLRAGYVQVIRIQIEEEILGFLMDDNTNKITKVVDIKC